VPLLLYIARATEPPHTVVYVQYYTVKKFRQGLQVLNAAHGRYEESRVIIL